LGHLGNDKALAMYQRILVPIDGSPTSNTGRDERIKHVRVVGDPKLCGMLSTACKPHGDPAEFAVMFD
jgi:nucleotide-binding universal stress UspA family protein